MTKRHPAIITTIIALAFGAIPFIFSENIAYAKHAEVSDKKAAEASQDSDDKKDKNSHTKKSTKAKDKLTNNRLRTCKKKEETIRVSMQRVSTQGERQLAVFHEIAERTKKFYSDNGYSNPEYTPLVTNLDGLYQTSLTTVQSLSTLSTDWNCDSDNPKQQLQLFRDAKKAETEVLKTYKEKVRELILLVKQSTKEDN